MAMSFAAVAAGPGYQYLTNQVATGDATTRDRMPLADYYDLKGEAPGRWYGAGLAGLGIESGEAVSEEQMLALFGRGEHPLSMERLAALAPDATVAEKRDAVRIGRPFRQPEAAISAFQEAVNQHFVAWNLAHRNPKHAAVPASVRASIRTKVATAWYAEIEGRLPDARELAGFLAKASRPPAKVVAGFDGTFSPMKSVSALWALVDRETATDIEQAHNLAVEDALRFLESKKTFTRRGRAGAQQVETRGLIATVFTHRDTRAGDPDLHTHVVIANKVQAASDGEWLALDGRPLHKAITAASETYNTALQAHLTERLGVVWQDVPRTDGRQPVREIIGVDPQLTKAWSKRRADITDRAGELAMAFHHNHGRPPTPAEQQDLYQQATLETREAKHEPRSRNEQREAWRAEADRVLGQGGVEAMLSRVFSQTARAAPTLDGSWFARTAELVMAGVEERRGQWQEVHVRAEAQRQVRTAGVRPADLEATVEHLIAHVLGRSVRLTQSGDGIEEPAVMRRLDGTSVYRVAGSDWYTSERMLYAERRIIDAAGRTGGRSADTNSIEMMLLAARATDTPLNPSQTDMVVAMATSGRRVQLALAPAGSGKTTAMRALKTAWANSGGDVVGLAPSATAAKQLGQALGADAPTDTLHKLAHDKHKAAWAGRITDKTLVIIDEAGMADTLVLDQVISYALDQGASVRLVGDDQQLGAIASGGVLRDIAAQHHVLRLDEVMRFHDPAERAASLALREGDPGALGFYYDQGRVHVGDPTTAAAGLFDAWLDDKRNRLDALMLAPTRDQVADLNRRARAHRLREAHSGIEADLADGNRASKGDIVLTRHNNRRLRAGSDGWVRNGDRWTVLGVRGDGGLDVRHNQTGRKTTLPAGYVTQHTELGYATTIHTAQGVTADTCHGLATDAMSRQQLYTMLTRGRHANHAWLASGPNGDPEARFHPATISPPTPNEVLEGILARDDSPVSVTTQLARAVDPASLLGEAVVRYHDAIRYAAAEFAGPEVAAQLERAADATGIPLVDADAWNVLKSHLLVLHANGLDAANILVWTASEEGVEDARDPAAVIDYRIDIHDLRVDDTHRPLPWLPGIPKLLDTHPTWAPYLAQRASLVETLVRDLRSRVLAGEDLPRWARELSEAPSRDVLADIAIWRASHQVADADLRPTGPVRNHVQEARVQHRLDGRLAKEPAVVLDWVERIHDAHPDTIEDPAVLRTARACAKADPHGEWLPRRLLGPARVPLPDEHKADALRSRLDGLLTPERIDPDASRRGPGRDRHELPLPRPTRSPGIDR